MDLLLLAIIASIILLGMAAVQWGADTRPTNLDPRYSSGNGIS